MHRANGIGRVLLVVFACWGMIPVNAGAQPRVGIRGSISHEPSMGWLGVHVQTQPSFPIVFRTTLEGGLGTEMGLSGDIDLALRLLPSDRRLGPYVGVGVSAAVFSGPTRQRPDVSYHVGGGYAVLVGVQHRRGFFSEFRTGVTGVDDVGRKLTFGYVFAGWTDRSRTTSPR